MPASHNSESNPKENSRFLAPLTPGTFSSTVSTDILISSPKSPCLRTDTGSKLDLSVHTDADGIGTITGEITESKYYDRIGYCYNASNKIYYWDLNIDSLEFFYTQDDRFKLTEELVIMAKK